MDPELTLKIPVDHPWYDELSKYLRAGQWPNAGLLIGDFGQEFIVKAVTEISAGGWSSRGSMTLSLSPVAKPVKV